MSAIFLMDKIFKFSKVKIFFKIEVAKSIRINHKNCVRKLKSNWFSLSTVEQKFYEVGFEVFCVKLMLGGTICFSADSTRRYLSLACTHPRLHYLDPMLTKLIQFHKLFGPIVRRLTTTELNVL